MNYMKINIKPALLISLLIIAAGISIVSCKKGFLDVTDPNVYSADNYPATVEDLNIELNDLYGRFRSGVYSPENFRFFGVSRDHSANQAYQDADFNAATGCRNAQGRVGKMILLNVIIIENGKFVIAPQYRRKP